MEITEISSRIKANLVNIDNCLDSMEGDSYIPNNTKITLYVTEIKELFENLRNNYPSEVVEKLKKEVGLLTKLIDKKFDNVIKNKNIELQELSKQLNSLQNQKKIVNYR